MRAPSGRSRRNRGVRLSARILHALFILSLLVGLATPLASLAPSTAAQTGPLPPPLPVPNRVALAGSFQTALGCPADNDPSCPQTQLHDNGDGTWSAVLPAPPGDYTFRVVASSDSDRSLGAGGDPNGADLALSVPTDAAGAYFRYDSSNGDITAEPVAAIAELTTDLGERFAMAPLRRGGYEVTWDAQPGNYGIQILFNGQQVGQDSVSLDGPRRVIVDVDDSGNVTTKDTLRDTRLDVAAVDANGQPRAGSCFAIIDRDGKLLAQACDGDDGQSDGSVELRVPNGLDDGNYTLRETFTPEGGTPAEDQRVNLGAGRFDATATAGGEAAGQPAAEETPSTEKPGQQQPGTIQPQAGQPIVQPGEQPGQLIVVPVDANGQPLPGACFAIVELGFEFCDSDGDGSVVFDAVPSAPLTLRETVPPAGYAPVADLPISIDPSGARILVPHQPAGEGSTPAQGEETPQTQPAETPQAQPAETPPAIAGASPVTLTLVDRDGNPATGGCWALSEKGSETQVQRCDADDGATDGVITFDPVPAGRYRLDEVTTPPGFQPADSQGLDVEAGKPAEATIQYRNAQGQQGQQGQPGRLVIVVTDDRGHPVEQTCFDLRGPTDLNDVCDRQNDGRLNIPDLPAGDYVVTQTRTADGFTMAPETPVTVPAGDTVELPLQNPRTESQAGQEAVATATPTAAPATAPPSQGQVVIDVVGEDGSTIPGACVTLDGASPITVCDDGDGDQSTDPGRIQLASVPSGDYTLNVDPPDGFTAPSPSTVTVQDGQNTRIQITLAAAGPDTGELAMTAQDADGNLLPGACYTVAIAGQEFGPFCDDDNDGRVSLSGVVTGPLTVSEDRPPTGAAPADPRQQDVQIVAGQQAQLTFRHGAPSGNLDVRITDANGQPLAACVDLTGEGGTLTICDGGDGDTSDQPGEVRFANIPPGDYSAALSSLPQSVTAPPAQQVTVQTGETAQLAFSVAAGTGALVLFVKDENGQRLGGSCFDIQGGDTNLTDVCDQGDDGRLNIPDLPPGDYTLTQTRAATGRKLAAAQTATVTPGQTTEVTLQNPLQPQTPTPSPTATPTATPTEAPTATPTPEATATQTSVPSPQATAEQPAAPGTLSVVDLDPDGNRLAGGCFSLADANGSVVVERCDNDQNDTDNAPGVIAFGSLPAGHYTLTQTRAPDGFALADPVQLDHGANAETIDVVNQPTAPETGAVEFATFDDGGNPVTGQCYTLAGQGSSFGPFCDNGEGDTSPDPGVLVVQGLPAGTYEATLQTAPEQGGVAEAQQANPRRSVSVRKGNRPTRVDFNIRAQQTQRGDLLVRVRDQNGDYLAGACFGVIPDGQSKPDTELCDNRGDDKNGSDGRILFSGMKDGRYTLTQTTVPRGYEKAADQSVRVAAGDVREVAVVNRAEKERATSLDITTTDSDGNPLPGACYEVLKGTSSSEACDADSGASGVTQFTDLQQGAYVLRQTQPPTGGFATASDTALNLEAGQTNTATVVNELRPGSLLLRKTDSGGQLLAGACFALIRGDRSVYTVCDNDASDGNQNDGLILLGTVTAGTYTLRETRAPTGYQVAADQQITVTGNQRSQLDVADTAAPPPQRTGTVRVFKTDGNGQALAGSCFAVVDGNGQTIASACDNDDNADDGTILMEGVAVGNFTLRETRRPSADYETAADVAVQVSEGRTADVTVQNQLRAGGILIRKTDPNGVALADACFDLTEDNAAATCTDDTGQLLFSGLAPGTYTVVETQAPPGYFVAPAIDPVTVRPGSTATVDVVDQPVPPPPDSGSIQVRKFVCPATEGNAGIVFVDSSDPDGGELARTAGCDLGDAAFTLDGPSGPLQFRTGAGGRYQTTLPTGDYVLTEQSTGATENVSIAVNTLTTVVVLNYVAPPAPQPATIDVVKYTCAPGFQGRVWADFADGCLSTDTLTNNVNFRISGPVSARRTTGDSGVGGATRFDTLPPGDYTLREETPLGTVAIYAFCGVDPTAPDGRSVGDTLTLRLTAGQAVTCHWFNVPEDLTGNTGAITVYKYACPITVPPTTFDWFGRCDPHAQDVQFSLSLWDGSQFQPVTSGATDADGILRFTRLQPGTYDLKEIGATWCHAESDSVDAQGHVVAAAGKRASVWIFDCVGAKNPPNTGAGPMWSPGGLAGSAIGIGLGFLWPLLGLGALRRRRA